MMKKGRGWFSSSRGEGGVYIADPGPGPSGHITLDLPRRTLLIRTMCNAESCPLFDSKHGTPCLLLHNAETSILSEWSTILLNFQLNASSEERITQMAEFISMLSSTLGESTEPGTRAHLMWRDTTRMFLHLEGHLRRVTTMQSKMAILLRGDWNDLYQSDFLQLATCGLKSLTLHVSQSFGRYVNHWLHVHWSLNSLNSAPSLPGNFHQSEFRMRLHRELSSTRIGFLSSMVGYETTYNQVQMGVSYLARRLILATPTRGVSGAPPQGVPSPLSSEARVR